MDRDSIVERLKWFCEHVGGNFQIERSKFNEVYSCVGNFDLTIETDLTKNNTKHLHLSGGHANSDLFFGIEIPLSEEDELDLEKFIFAKSDVEEIKTRYYPQKDYVLNTNTINIKNAKKIEFRIHKNTLDVLIF